jgi:ABC-type sugar transport system ATPase subunit
MAAGCCARWSARARACARRRRRARLAGSEREPFDLRRCHVGRNRQRVRIGHQIDEGRPEPVNGLDPDGIRWIRKLMRDLAAERRTVFLSSHLMSETAQAADNLIIIGRGRVIADASVEEFTRRHSRHAVIVRSPQASRLVASSRARTSARREPRTAQWRSKA